MTTKQEALAQIAAIAKQHGLTHAETLAALRATPQQRENSIISKLFSYLGAVFILAGIGAFVAVNWGSMNSAARVIITLGSGFCAFTLGVIFARDEARRNFIPPLMLFAAFLETGGLFVLIDEYFGSGNNWRLACLVVFSSIGIQQFFTYLSLRMPVLLFNTLWAWMIFTSVAFDMLGIDTEWNATLIGLMLLLIGYGLQGVSEHFVIRPCYFFGSLLFLSGIFWVLIDTPLEILYIGICGFMMFVSVVVQSVTILVVSVISMLSFISYFTARHFADSVGWPITLIVIGVLFFAVGLAAVKLKKRYIS